MKESEEPEFRTQYRKWIFLFLAIGALFAVFWTQITGYGGLPEIHRLQVEIERLQESNRQLSLENEKLFNEVQYRRSDQYLEEILRIELGYAKNGEQIFKWSQEAPEDAVPNPHATVSPSATIAIPPIDP